MNPRQIMSPGTFEELSRELDNLMAGERQATQRHSNSASRRSVSTDYNFVSAISSLSHETTSTLSDNTPIVGNSLRWPRNTYTLDVLGEPSSSAPYRGRSQQQIPRTRSWQHSESGDTSDVSGRLSVAPSPSNSSRGEDGMETMLADDGGVTVRSARSAKRFLRKIT